MKETNNKERSLLGAKNQSIPSEQSFQAQIEEGEISSDSEDGEMELTGCVGEILAVNTNYQQEMQIDLAAHQSSSPVPMEMTTCVGEILQQIKPQNEDCEMEMTVCVGKILNPSDEEMLLHDHSKEPIAEHKELESQSNAFEEQQQDFQSNSSSEANIKNHKMLSNDTRTFEEGDEVKRDSNEICKEDTSRKNNLEVTNEMEMTTCIGKIIQEANSIELATCLGNVVKENTIEMEMTVSVGSVLDGNSNENPQMEMTVSVGKCLGW